MRVLGIFIHGTTGLLGNYGTRFFKRVASTFCSDIFTAGIEEKLIPLQGAPVATQNFKPLFEEFVAEEDCYYFQWSGNLSDQARRYAASQLAISILDLISDEDDINIIIPAHSFGGAIARHAAEILAPYKNIKFHIISIAMPQCSTPPTLMPENVVTWYHFYNDMDFNAWIGSWLMQNLQLPVYRRTEDVAKIGGFQLPPDYKSYSLDCSLGDVHNNALRNPAAKTICTTVKPILEKKIAPLFHDALPYTPEPEDKFVDAPVGEPDSLHFSLK